METILDEYDQTENLLNDFKSKVETLLFNLLKSKRINFHHITSRKKDKVSLVRKIDKKGGYSCLNDITDIIGCRIITYFEDDVDNVASIIEKEFKIDSANSVDKRKVEYDRFGYQSLHYVVLLSNSRLRLTEYKQFKSLKLEIQIRSILQHSWAEIEHDIGYKGKHSIPDIAKRRFSRIAALLETADLEFVALRNELSEYERTIKKEIEANPESVKLDKASIVSFISTDKNLQSADMNVAKFLNLEISPEDSVIEQLLSLLEFSGIKTIHDLQKVYAEKHDCIIAFAKKWREPRIAAAKSGRAAAGISIYDLGYMLIAKNRKKDELLNFLKSRYEEFHRDWQKQVDKIFDSFNKLDKNCR
jgi:putative GTP pyrophosphokinase